MYGLITGWIVMIRCFDGWAEWYCGRVWILWTGVRWCGWMVLKKVDFVGFWDCICEKGHV